MMTKTFSFFAVLGLSIACLGLGGQAHAGLINYWAFDEISGATADDSAGSLDLTLNNGAAFSTDATRGQVLSLDGTDDYANNSGEPFASDMTNTVAFWANYSLDENDYIKTEAAIGWGVSGERYFIATRNKGGSPLKFGMRAGLGGGTTTYFNDSSSEPLGDTWQYWTLVRELENVGTENEVTTVKLYIDGVLSETQTVADCGSISTEGMTCIGSSYSGAETFVRGLLDDVAIWDEALTADQISNAMTLGADRYNVPEPSSIMLILSAALAGIFAMRRSRQA